MATMRERMLTGLPYRDDDRALVAERLACRQARARFNAAAPEDEQTRAEVLTDLLGDLGPGVRIMPPPTCDDGTQIRIGRDSFLNYDAIVLDCAPVQIGAQVFIGPRAQLVTALHPMDDHAARRAGWETAAPITIGDGAWLGAGVIVCPGVTIGADTVIGAGSVVTRSIPPGVFAAGDPCRVVRRLGAEDGPDQP